MIKARKKRNLDKIEVINLITTPPDASFDAFASMIAASKLFPQSHFFFAGSIHYELRQFLRKVKFNYPLISREEINWQSVQNIIIVKADEQRKLAQLMEILGPHKAVKHLFCTAQIPDEYAFDHKEYRNFGATTTLMMKVLQRERVNFAKEEATLFALGIYDGTGCFTNKNTTADDFYFLHKLLKAGAEIEKILEFLPLHLSTEQHKLLDDFLSSVKRFQIGNVKVSFCSAIYQSFSGELRIVFNKLSELERADVICIFVQIKTSIYLIIRSHHKDINVQNLIREFGGSGFYDYGVAVIRDKTVAEMEDKVMESLRVNLKPEIKLKDIMSEPVISLPPTATLDEAQRTMNRLNINTLCVVSGSKMKGLITRKIVDKAIGHGLGNNHIKEYMEINFQTASPDDDPFSTFQMMLANNIRFLPIIDKGKPVGIVTRTMLIGLLYDNLIGSAGKIYDERQLKKHYLFKNLSDLLNANLESKILSKLREIGSFADRLGVKVYLVGGMVRDLLLGIKNEDIDVIVRGDAVDFAEKFACEIGGIVIAQSLFKTAKIRYPDGMVIDLATARAEYYEEPVALPTVLPGSLRQDMFRRDFTINAMAIQLNSDQFGNLIDYFGGFKDLNDRVLNVIHSLSFIEDPTRILRAVRFSTRLGFSIGKQTLKFIEVAIKQKVFSKLSGQRIQHELIILFNSPLAVEAISQMNELNVLQEIFPKLPPYSCTRELILKISEIITWHRLTFKESKLEYWLIYLMGIFNGLDSIKLKENFNFLALTKEQRSKIEYGVLNGEELLFKLKEHKTSSGRISLIYRNVSDEVILLIMAKTDFEEERHLLCRYLMEWRNIKPQVDGEDLIALGLTPGPEFNTILNDLFVAKIDLNLQDKQQELSYIKKRLKKEKDD